MIVVVGPQTWGEEDLTVVKVDGTMLELGLKVNGGVGNVRLKKKYESEEDAV